MTTTKKLFLLIPAMILLTGLSAFKIPHADRTVKPAQPGIPSNLDMGSALKEALQIGTSKSTNQLSAVDGFLGNPSVKILFPPEAKKVENTLRGLGLGKLCDNVILSMNRAAENAAKDAEPIFLDAIRHMSIQDAGAILFGPKDAATQYFRRTTTAELFAKFRPVIQASLNKVGATKYYADAAGEYNKLPFIKHINPDITDYATQKTIDGLFTQIALEELNIRQNLSARTTPLLQRIFGYGDRKPQ